MNRLLIALDVDDAAEASALAEKLGDLAAGFKVGSQLFTAAGPGIVQTLTSRGHRVFLDLKFHDIPNTVAGATRAAARLGVWMLTVHASGGLAMMKAAAGAAQTAAHPPLIVAVTVLTSLSNETLAELGVTRTLPDQVAALATAAKAAGLHGVVASPHEIGLVRAHCGPAFSIVTPGIRPAAMQTGSRDDQVRTMSPREAVAAGADYLVVGRPIVAAPDPRAVAEQIRRETG